MLRGGAGSGMARLLLVCLMLCTALLVEATSPPVTPPPAPPPAGTPPPPDKCTEHWAFKAGHVTGCSVKELRNMMMMDFGLGIFGFFAFTSIINCVGILYDRKLGRNKVTDGE